MNSIRTLLTTIATIAAAALSLAGLLSPASASAATSCEYDTALDLLSVTMNGRNDHASITVSGNGSDILVRAQGPIVTCTGGQATLTTTDNITIVDNGDNPDTPATADGDATVTLPDATALTPGATAESGDDEIELLVNFNDGNHDSLTVFGSDASDAIRLGDQGVNWAVGPGGLEERELLYSEPDTILVDGGAGNDVISAQGGEGTDDPVDNGFLDIAGGDDADQLSGGDALGSADGDLLRGGEGGDTLSGFAGDDSLRPGLGDDAVSGGAGADEVTFTEPGQTTGISVDLSLTAPQATGQGSDTISATENVSGTQFDDTLTGSDAANHLRGNSGSDVLDGGAGADQLDGGGGPGPDTVTYAEAPAGVTANLTAGTASGGSGADTLDDFEDLTGSHFADTLTGDAEANSINALGGTDQVSSLGGTDTVDVRDGGSDSASCGTEADTAVADQRSVDSVNADCESVDFLAETGGGGGDAGGGGGNGGDAALLFRLKGNKRQDVLDRKGALVTALCPLEPCSVKAKASGKLSGGPAGSRATSGRLKLKPAGADLAAGERAKIRLRLRNRQRDLLADALAGPGAPRLKVAATATDEAGNRVTRTRKIRISG